nr:hypothetical protein [Tanacetum cinerariifolium]
MLFGDGDFSDDDSKGFEDEEEVWEVNEEWLMVPVTPPSMPVVPPPSTYEVGGPSNVATEGQPFTLLVPGFLMPPTVIEDLSTRMGNLEYRHGQLVKKVIYVSDAEVANGITIREIGPMVSAIEGHVHVMTIMGEPLSLDRVFDFLMDEPEPHPAYDFFSLESLPGYAGNPNNNNKWIEADVPLLEELGAVADESMVGPLVDEIAE